MGRQHEDADCGRVDSIIPQVPNRQIIAVTLGHLGAFHEQELTVHPEPSECLAGSPLRLSDFVFVVRKNEIDSTGVDIQGFYAKTPFYFCQRLPGTR